MMHGGINSSIYRQYPPSDCSANITLKDMVKFGKIISKNYRTEGTVLQYAQRQSGGPMTNTYEARQFVGDSKANTCSR